MIRELIAKLVEGLDLTEEETRIAVDEVMTGQATDAQIAGFITALRMKGETVDEITGAARAMRAHATPVKTRHETLVDTCGTGGDRANTFNISTTAAFVVAGAGAAVAKHGNRSVSSRSGSADVLEALGVDLTLSPAEVGAAIDEVGIGFLFAPVLHGAMKHAVGPRREMGIRTIFNVLGPLTNPAGAQVQILGVYDPDLTEVLGGVLRNLGARRAFVVHGAGGLDEFSTIGPNRVTEVKAGQVWTYELDPQEYGFSRATLEELRGGTPAENAAITMDVLAGARGPRREVVVLNAGAALTAAGCARTLAEGFELARRSIDSGAALEKMHGLRRFTRGGAA